MTMNNLHGALELAVKPRAQVTGATIRIINRTFCPGLKPGSGTATTPPSSTVRRRESMNSAGTDAGRSLRQSSRRTPKVPLIADQGS